MTKSIHVPSKNDKIAQIPSEWSRDTAGLFNDER
jgi:hypothetical protein